MKKTTKFCRRRKERVNKQTHMLDGKLKVARMSVLSWTIH